MKRRMLITAVLTAAVLLCAGCGNASGNQSRTITDMKERNVVLNGDVTRVVALTAADCEIIYAIGAGDAVVGRGEYCDYPEAALSLPAVQSGAETNIEQIVALTPQVVFRDTMDQSVEQIQQLELRIHLCHRRGHEPRARSGGSDRRDEANLTGAV